MPVFVLGYVPILFCFVCFFHKGDNIFVVLLFFIFIFSFHFFILFAVYLFFFVPQSLPTLFGPLSHDLTPYSYLALRLRLGLGIRDAWYINLRTTDMPPTDLWQHRLYFRGDLQSNYGEIRVCISLSSSNKCPFFDYETQKRLGLPRSHLRISHTPAEASTLKRTKTSSTVIECRWSVFPSLVAMRASRVHMNWGSTKYGQPTRSFPLLEYVHLHPPLSHGHVSDPPNRPVRRVTGLQCGLESQFGCL